MTSHGESTGEHAWCASCNRWIEAASAPAVLLFSVVHAHGAGVAERAALRRAGMRDRAAAPDERLVADVVSARKAVSHG
jgi:hypothetical protein